MRPTFRLELLQPPPGTIPVPEIRHAAAMETPACFLLRRDNITELKSGH